MPGHGDCRAPTSYMWVTMPKEQETSETDETAFFVFAVPIRK
jgi:hypothetical protein